MKYLQMWDKLVGAARLIRALVLQPDCLIRNSTNGRTVPACREITKTPSGLRWCDRAEVSREHLPCHRTSIRRRSKARTYPVLRHGSRGGILGLRDRGYAGCRIRTFGNLTSRLLSE